MRKNKLSLLIAALVLSLDMQAQTNDGISAMNAAIEKFLGSGQLLTKDTHWSHAQDQWYYKYTIEGDTLVEPQAFVELKDAFGRNMSHGWYGYMCDAGKVKHKQWELQFHRKDNFYGGIYGRYRVEEDDNVRVVAIGDSLSQTYYGLKWDVEPFTDSSGKKWQTLEGELFVFKDGIWKIEAHYEDRKWQQLSGFAPISKDDQLKYETLMTQLRSLSEQTGNGGGMRSELRIYITKKLFDEYDGMLTEQQYGELYKMLKMLADGRPAEERRIYDTMRNNLSRRVRYLPRGKFAQSNMTNKGTFTDPDQERMLQLEYDLGGLEAPRVTVKVSGRAEGQVQVQPVWPSLQPYKVLPDRGMFTFMESLPQSQLLEVSDQKSHKLLLFADTIPTEVNMAEMTVKGSPLNERFAEVQRRLKAIEADLRKSCIRDNEGGYIVMDRDGYKAWQRETQRLQQQLMDENLGNMIPAWLLAENHTVMTHKELSRYMRHRRPYSDHVAMQPVWQYYEGLAKRLPGKKFSDAACVDTAGVAHRLSEYIGKGDYVVMQFWEERNWTAHSGCKIMKYLFKEYKGKNIRILGVSLDCKKDTWARYVKKRGLSYEQVAIISTDEESRWDDPLVKAYGIRALPETIIFDPKGRILSSGLAGEELKKAVAELPLKEK